MLPLLALASITTALSSTSGAQSAIEQAARAGKNREFIADHYPPGALKRGEQGAVAFRVTIEPDGSLGSCQVTKSSGYPGLDNETCEVMIFNARLKPVKRNGRAVRATQDGFIVWRHPSLSTQVASAGKNADASEIICKMSPKAGSMIIKVKQCLTKREWLHQEQVVKDEMERIQFRAFTSGGH